MEKKDFLEPGFFYHIFNRGNNRENIFIEEDNYFYFYRLFDKHLLPIVNLYSYCLMKNHFHLLIKVKDDELLEAKYRNQERHLYQPFSNFFNAYTKGMNRRYGRTGSLFQCNFKRIRIVEEKYLKNVIIYIHLNPMNHGFTIDYQNYPFSSYKILLSDKETILYRNEVISWFEDRENFISVHENSKKDIGFLDIEGL